MELIEKTKAFWNVFWNSIKSAYSQAFNKQFKTSVQKFSDVIKRNYLASAVNTLNNLVNTEATFELVSDSVLSEPLIDLTKELEKNRYVITADMLGEGGSFCLPEISENGTINHTYIPQRDAMITKVDGNEILELYAIIKTTELASGDKFVLVRHHKLDPVTGDLTVSYDIRNGAGERTYFEEWKQYYNYGFVCPGANHLGVAYYKSPVDSRGLSPVYGVPLNFACSEIERDIAEFEELLKSEYKNGKSLIFGDPRIMMKKSDSSGYDIPENMYPVKNMQGTDGIISIFNPTIRSNEYMQRREQLMIDYEKAIGVNRGILSQFEYTANATKDEVRRANADTISLIEKIRAAIHKGNEDTLKADSVYLNIPIDDWVYKSEWFDPFENPDSQWGRLKDAVSIGAAETTDLMKWIFPTLTDEEIEEKMQRIKTEENEDANKSLENMLNM